MADNETPVTSKTLMDRAEPLGNYPTADGRRALATINASLMGTPALSDNGTVDTTSTSDIYKFYQGATLLKTITLNYTDSTKNQLLSWAVT